jgi:hypothetical protein
MRGLAALVESPKDELARLLTGLLKFAWLKMFQEVRHEREGYALANLELL